MIADLSDEELLEEERREMRRQERREFAAMPPLDRFRARLATADSIEDLPDPEPLVEGVLMVDSLAELYGASGVGKTFLALDLALSVASGIDWHGRPCAHGPVLYVVAEGVTGIKQRVQAWKSRRHIAAVPQFHILPLAVNMLDAAEAGALAEIAGCVGARLVVIDTLNRCLPGGDENASGDMGRFIAAADAIRDVNGACVLTNHHPGKDPAAGSRGHSSFAAAMDTRIEFKDGGVLRVEKQKDGPSDYVLDRFQRVDELESQVIELATGVHEGSATDSASLAMMRVLYDCDAGDGLTTSKWEKLCDDAGVKDSTFYRRLKILLADGCARKRDSKARAPYVLTAKGIDLVASNTVTSLSPPA